MVASTLLTRRLFFMQFYKCQLSISCSSIRCLDVRDLDVRDLSPGRLASHLCKPFSSHVIPKAKSPFFFLSFYFYVNQQTKEMPDLQTFTRQHTSFQVKQPLFSATF
jgi:hypothetical protein